MSTLFVPATILLVLLSLSPHLARADRYFTTTAVISNSSDNNQAAFQCWQRHQSYTPYPTIGSSLSLANLTNAALVSLPAGGKEGLHNPPHPMLFVQLRGCATVTLPSDPEGHALRILAGDAIVAVDTEGEGHLTEYGGEEDALAMQAFFDEGWEKAWEVLYDGVCDGQTALRRGGAEQQSVLKLRT